MEWNSDTYYALGLHKKLESLLGIWPNDFKNIFSKLRLAFVMIVMTSMCIRFVEQLLQKGACGTITEIVDLISLVSCGMTLLMKLVVLIIHRNDLSIIVNSAVKDWSGILEHRSRLIMLQYASIGKIVFILQASFCSMTLFFIIFNRLPPIEYFRNNQLNATTTVIGLPLWPACWTPTDISVNHYIALFIFQCITIVNINASYCNCDCFFFGMVMHLSGQFYVQSSNIEYFHEDSNSKYYARQLVKLIERHQYLLMLVNIFEETYNLVILLHVGVATATICITGVVLLASLESSNFQIVGDMLCRIFITYLQLFMYCYAGEQLQTVTMNMKNVIHNSPWFNMPSRTVRDMILIIMRCDYPSNLTAGKLYTLNLPNFITIIKTTSSYFSVIRLAFKENH